MAENLTDAALRTIIQLGERATRAMERRTRESRSLAAERRRSKDLEAEVLKLKRQLTDAWRKEYEWQQKCYRFMDLEDRERAERAFRAACRAADAEKAKASGG